MFLYELTVRVPTADDENFASLPGLYTDFTDRYGAYIPDAIPVELMGNYMNTFGGVWTLRLRGGLLTTIGTDDNDTEFLVNVGALGGYMFANGAIHAGINTLTILSEEDLDFSERMISSLIFAGEFGAGNIVPGLIVRLPLDEDISDFVSLTVGLSLKAKL